MLDRATPVILDLMEDIVEFHEKFFLTYDGPARQLEGELGDFRVGFMEEELTEYKQARLALEIELRQKVRDRGEITHLLEQQLDALIDLTYVVLGTAYLQFGPLKFKEGWNRVHLKNMAKVRAERAEDSKRGTTFDVVKPVGWTPPSHTDLVEDHEHA